MTSPFLKRFLALLFENCQFYSALVFWGVKSKTRSSIHSLKLLFKICCLLGLIGHSTRGSLWPLGSYTLQGYKRMFTDTMKSYRVRAISKGHHGAQPSMPASAWPSSDRGVGWICILWNSRKTHPSVMLICGCGCDPRGPLHLSNLVCLPHSNLSIQEGSLPRVPGLHWVPFI